MMMKNFNRRNVIPMATMAQSAANRRTTHIQPHTYLSFCPSPAPLPSPPPPPSPFSLSLISTLLISDTAIIGLVGMTWGGIHTALYPRVNLPTGG